jgi:hypothetical protein
MIYTREVKDLGVSKMAKQRPHEVAEEHHKRYEREARLQYGAKAVNDSYARWNSYTKSQQDYILEEAGKIYTEFVAAMEAGLSAEDSEVQALTERWHQNLRNFYEPSLEMLRGLGELYTNDADFGATFAKFHAKLAVYLKAAIEHYVDELETAEIQRMLEEDERLRKLSR